MANYKMMSVIQDMVPRSWQPDSESHFVRKLYSLFYVLPYTEEFYHVAHPLLLDGYEPTCIKRIQNITMFGRYAVRRLQTVCRRGSNQNVDRIGYTCIPKENQYLMCQHNLDPRHKIVREKQFILYGTPKQAIANCTKNNPVLIVLRTIELSNSNEIYPEYIIDYARQDNPGWGTRMTRKYHEHDRRIDHILKKVRTSEPRESAKTDSARQIFEVAKLRGVKRAYKECPPTCGTYGTPALWTPAPHPPRSRGGRHVRSQSVPTRGDYRGYSHPRNMEYRFHRRCPSDGFARRGRPNRY